MPFQHTVTKWMNKKSSLQLNNLFTNPLREKYLLTHIFKVTQHPKAHKPHK